MNKTQNLRPIISHEIPHSLAEAEARGEYKINDYLFVLLHRYIEDARYRDIVDSYQGFKIMDNSCFELGAALSNELIAEYVEIVNPDVFVLPDTLGDKNETISRTLDFASAYPEMVSRAMAVIQGDTPEEFAGCYKSFVEELSNIAMIGIPFCYNWSFKANHTPVQHAVERVKLLEYLEKTGTIVKSIKHHLLGTWFASEFTFYKDYDWIYSIDTSNPIAAGIEGNRYPITHKPRPRFDEFVDLELQELNIDYIIYNVNTFREYCGR